MTAIGEREARFVERARGFFAAEFAADPEGGFDEDFDEGGTPTESSGPRARGKTRSHEWCFVRALLHQSLLHRALLRRVAPLTILAR